MKPLRILLACEESQAVCVEMRKRGHEAFSCDIQPCSGGHPEWHIQGDVLEQLGKGWDMMIAFPPCQYLCNSGIRWLYQGGKKANGRDEKRWNNMRRGAIFFNRLLNSGIPKICIENSRMHIHAIKIVGKQSHKIQPWEFGHGETKETWLWLRGLPPLMPTNIVNGREAKVHKMAPGPDRSKLRAKTYPGIARAIAEQYTSNLIS